MAADPATTPADQGNPLANVTAAIDRRAAFALTDATAPAVSAAPQPIRAYQRDTIFRRALVAADLVAVSLSFALALGLGGLRPAVLLLPVLTVLAAKTMGLYDRDQLVVRKRTLDEAPALFQLATLLSLVAWLGHDLVSTAPVGRVAIVALWALTFVNHLLWRTTARRLAQVAAPTERCLLVGDAAEQRRLRDKLAGDARLKAEVVASLPLLERRAGHTGGAPHGSLEQLVRDLRVHRVIVAPDGADYDTTQAVVTRAKRLGVNVSVLPRIHEIVGSSVEFDELGGMTLLGIRPFGLQRSSRLLKRTVDTAGAIFGLLVAAPAMAVIAVAIRLDSRGPILFRQTRVGQGGEHFEILKFRTMHAGADRERAELAARSNGDGLFKVPDDPRITRVGRFLRRTSLDELPQAWNVLRGDMSLVGPRPLILEEDERVVGFHRRRLDLKPGLTGPWQVLGSAKTRVGLNEMVTIDYLYAANWTLWADVQVIIRTIAHVLGGRGV